MTTFSLSSSIDNNRTCTTFHRYPIFSKSYTVLCKVYTGYCGTSEIEHGLCACTVDNPRAKARGLSLRTGAQPMLYLPLVYLETEEFAKETNLPSRTQLYNSKPDNFKWCFFLFFSQRLKLIFKCYIPVVSISHRIRHQEIKCRFLQYILKCHFPLKILKQ